MDEVRADTVWVKDYDIYGILGVEVGYWKSGTFWGFDFFLEVLFFRCTLLSRIYFHSSEHCSNVYYVLSENHHLLSALL